jgi:hypothetical protein
MASRAYAALRADIADLRSDMKALKLLQAATLACVPALLLKTVFR